MMSVRQIPINVPTESITLEDLDRAAEKERQAMQAEDNKVMERLLNEEYLKQAEASQILGTAQETLVQRAVNRDSVETGERSMAAAVSAFNALYGTEVSETQGWMFMVFLKAARARQGEFNLDDYVDGAAYFALAGESASKSA